MRESKSGWVLLRRSLLISGTIAALLIFAARKDHGPFLIESETPTSLKLLDLVSAALLGPNTIVAFDSLRLSTAHAPNLFILSLKDRKTIPLPVSERGSYPLAIVTSPSDDAFYVQFWNGAEHVLRKFSTDGVERETTRWRGSIEDHISFGADGRLLRCGTAQVLGGTTFLGGLYSRMSDLANSKPSGLFFELPKVLQNFNTDTMNVSCGEANGKVVVVTEFEPRLFYFDTLGRPLTSLNVSPPKKYVSPQNEEFARLKEASQSVSPEKIILLESDWQWSFTRLTSLHVTDKFIFLGYQNASRGREENPVTYQCLTMDGKLIGESDQLGTFLGGTGCRFQTLVAKKPTHELPGIPYDYQLRTYRVANCSEESK